MSCAVFAFPENTIAAQSLAMELGVCCSHVDLHVFPDGESLVRVEKPARIALLYRSLDRPNPKFIELLLAAAALRDNGAEQVVLVAPYLAYMRQDVAFRPGEAVSQAVIGALIADHFDGLVTIDPHLHRVAHLRDVVPHIPAHALSAAPALAQVLRAEEPPVLVGPDEESRPWVEAIARPLGLDILLGRKRRRGDQDVELILPGIDVVAGKPAVLVDDVISSGATMIAAANLLRQARAASIEALATHGLASDDTYDRMRAAGITRIRTTLSVANYAACIPIAATIAQGIRSAGWA